MFELARRYVFKTYDPATVAFLFDISGNTSLKGIKMKVIIATIGFLQIMFFQIQATECKHQYPFPV